jgi:hypothetical protein
MKLTLVTVEATVTENAEPACPHCAFTAVVETPDATGMVTVDAASVLHVAAVAAVVPVPTVQHT